MDRRSREDSGLIDLDALMRQAADASTMTPTSPVDTATPAGRHEGHAKKKDDDEAAGLPPMPPALPSSEVAPLPRTSMTVTVPTASTAVSPSLVIKTKSPAPEPAKVDKPATPAKPPFIQMPMPITAKENTAGNRFSKSLRWTAILGAWAILIGGGVAFMMYKRAQAEDAAALAAAKTPVAVAAAAHESAPNDAKPVSTGEALTETTTTRTTSAPIPSASTKQPTGAGLLAALAPSPAATTAGQQPDPALTVNDATSAAANQASGDLGSAMKSAVGDKVSEGALTNGAESTGGAAQVHPSPGAVIGAIGTVMGSARACLGPDDPIRNGTITFKSDGSVARVELRGSARETDQCVRDALSKAKVQPFNDETFSTRVTVRP